MEQRVSGAKLTPWQGIALVALAAVFLLAAQFVLSFLQYVLTYFHLLPSEAAYAVASIAYWVTGGLVALQFLRNYVLNFLYTANTKQLRIERVYGSGRPRFLADVYFSRAKAFGEVDALKARFAQAKIVHAVHRRERLPIQALAYEDTDGLKILLFQPNEALCAHVRQALRENRGK